MLFLTLFLASLLFLKKLVRGKASIFCYNGLNVFMINKKLKAIDKAKLSKGMTVLLRINADVPLNAKGQIADDSRVKDAIPTINYLLKKQVKIVILNKIGRPNGKRLKKLSNLVVAKKLETLIKHKVLFCDDLMTDKVEAAVSNLEPGEILMTENTRFWNQEGDNDLNFAKRIASYGQIYVNEAFSVCHRNEATVSALSKLLPSYAGFSLLKEVNELDKVLTKKIKPKIAIIGGAKIDTKVELIKNLSAKVDVILLGGAIANSVLAARGHNLGKSSPSAKELLAAKSVLSNKLICPVDVVVAKSFSSKGRKKEITEIVSNDFVLDIGDKTIKLYSEIINGAKMIVWNGPVGLFEKNEFKNGTKKIAMATAKSKAYTICGGGETLLALKENKLVNKINFISMAGGAMLSYLAGDKMPGLERLY